MDQGNTLSFISMNQDFSPQNCFVKTKQRGFPGGAVVGSPPANAGDAGSSPGPGGSHVLQSNGAREPQLLSLRSGARKPQLRSLCA